MATLVAATPVAAVASSTYSTHVPANVYDDNPSTHWNTAADANGSWIYLDLGSQKTIYGWRWHFVKTSATEPAWSAVSKLQGSNDASSWTDIQTVDRIGGNAFFAIPGGVTYRYFRILGVSGSGGSWGAIQEFHVFTTYEPDYPVGLAYRPVIETDYNAGDHTLALDGDDATWIRSRYSGSSGAYYVVDAGADVAVSSIDLKQDGLNGLVIEYADDLYGPYTIAHTVADSTGDKGSKVTYSWTEQTARFWRVRGTAGGDWPLWYTVDFAFPEPEPPPPTFEGLWQYGAEFRVEIGLAGEGGSGAAVWGTSKWGAGTWTGYAPDWYDVSPYVIGAVAEYGAESFDERMRTGHARFLLDNDSGAFNPDSGAALASDLSLRPGRWIRLIGAISTYQRVLWQGYIDTIEEVYLPAASGSNTILHCFDFAGLLALDNPPALESAVGAGERTSARANRILNEFGPVSGGWPWRQVEPGVHTMRASTLAQNRLEEIQRAAQAEGGAFYFEGATARFRPFSWLSTNPRSTAVQIQPGSGTAGHPGVTGADAARRSARTIRNDIQVSRAEGTVQRFQDLASQALFGGVPRTWQFLAYENNKDTHVKALGERILAAYAYDRQTLRRVTMEPVDAASAQRLLDLRLGDLAEITVPDDLMGWGYSTEAHVLGIRYEIDNTDWEVKVRLDQSQTTADDEED